MKPLLLACMLAPMVAVQAQVAFDPLRSEAVQWDTVAYTMSAREAGAWSYAPEKRKNFSSLSRYINLDVSQVFSLCVDSRQQVWIGGGMGEVVRFNGRSFDHFQFSSFSANPVYDIFEDASGAMWFGSLADGLVKFDGHQCLSLKAPSTADLPEIGVFDLHQSPDGVLWICTNGNGIMGLRGDRLMHVKAPGPLADQAVTCAATGEDGTLWCGYYTAGLSALSPGRATHFGREAGLAGNKVFSLCLWEGHMLAGTRNGLYVCSVDAGIRLLPWSEGIFVFDMAEDKNHGLWIATNGAGLVRLSPTGGTHALLHPTWFTEDDGLSNNRLLDVVCDADGNVWAGTFGSGIARHSPDIFSNFDSRSGLPADKVWSLLPVSPDELWAGTSRGGLASVRADTCKALKPVRDIQTGDIHDIVRLRNGSIAFSVSGQGLYIGNGSRWKKIPFSKRLSLQTVLDICETDSLTGWESPVLCASFNGLLAVENDSLQPARFANGSMPLDVNQVEPGPHGTYWVASSDGLWCIHREQPGDSLMRCVPMPQSSGLRGQKITGLHASEDHLYAGSQGAGVWIFSHDDLQDWLIHKDTVFNAIRWNEAAGINSDYVSAVFVDSGKHVWIGTSHGINRLDATQAARALDPSFTGIIPFEHFGISAGLVNPEVSYHHVLETARGHVWFATNSALARFNPEAYHSDSQPPEIDLTGLRLYFEPVDWQRDERRRQNPSPIRPYFSGFMQYSHFVPFQPLPVAPVFSYDLNHLTFEFASRDWSFNQEVTHYIKLDGLDGQWNAIPAGTITYSALAPGTYVLRYKAINAAGLESTEHRFAFTIMPPLWKTRGFMLALAALAVSILLVLYKWRVRALERDKKNLEIKVAERTEELREERDKSDNLLLNILPLQTAIELKEKGEAATRVYDHASVLFTDFEGFTRLTGTMDSDALVRILDNYFKAFDRISSQYRIEKIKTIGDAYMCASGLFTPNPSHAAELVACGLAFLHAVEAINRERSHRGEIPWQVRIGIHSGPVIAGVVGKKKFAYDIWGDTVNLASRMESAGEPGKLNVSAATADACGSFFEFTPRGLVPIKGRGSMEMYFVRGFAAPYQSAGEPLLPSATFRDAVMRF